MPIQVYLRLSNKCILNAIILNNTTQFDQMSIKNPRYGIVTCIHVLMSLYSLNSLVFT